MFARPTKPLSLRARLATMMVALFLGGMIVLYVAGRTYAESAANRSFDRLLLGSALSIAETVSISNGGVDVDLPYAALDMLSAAPDDRVFYHVLGPSGEVVTGDADLPAPPPLLTDGLGIGGDAPRFFDADYSGERVRFAVLGRQLSQPGSAGWLWVQVGQTRMARNQLSNELVLNALAPIAAITVLALAIVWFGIRSALMPLTRVGQDLADRGPGDLSPITAPMPKEVEPLVRSMNEFMLRLDTNIEALRAFIAEAAHQMRTPLAALLAQAQVAAAGDQADQLRGLKAVERNGAKLSRLLNQLLSDATIIHRADIQAFEVFDLLRVVRLAVRESVPMTSGQEVRVDTKLRSAPFLGDGLMMGEAIKNVIHNAFNHGEAANGGLSVSLTQENAGYVIAIADRGPGIAESDRGHVFDRFARGASEAPGAGLGLAIVRRAVASHGGSVDLSDRDGGGLVVSLWVPEAGA